MLAIEVLDPLLIGNLAGRALFQPGASGKARVRARHNVGVRSMHFQGFAWQTLLARLSNDGLVGHLRDRLPSPYPSAVVLRVWAQNDIEGIFGESSKGQATKQPPRMLGPRFEELEYRDSVKHDRKRAESWEVQLSKRSAYDATEGMDVREALENCDGAGDAWESAPAVSWREAQTVRAVAAASGKQESARTYNTFFSNTPALAASSKRATMS